jgi:mRNA-degrading endonuclease toxin of MazEF toxin-antitoxin module
MPSVALTNQVTTIDKKNVVRTLGRLGPGDLNRLQEAVGGFFDL